MKTIFVRTSSNEAKREQALELYGILKDSTPVIAEVIPYKAEVRTETTQTRFFSAGQKTDGLRCDVPVNFGEYGKAMTKGRNFQELKTLKEIAKFIVEEGMR